MKLVDGLKTVTFTQNEFIMKEGDEGDDFYIIESGEIDCLKLYTFNQTKKGLVRVRVLV